MTNLLLENKNETKVDDLMEALMRDYKDTLKRDETVEKDILDFIQMDIDIKENHTIPYYSEKYGVDSIDKEYLSSTLEFMEEIDKLRKDKSKNEEKEIEELIIREITDKHNNRLEQIFTTLLTRKYKCDFEGGLWTKEYESLKLIGDCLDRQKFNQDDFKFHGDTFARLIEKHTKLESELKTVVDDYDKSKQQCLRIIKKTNYYLEKIYKKTGVIFIPVLTGDWCSPFITVNSEGTSISLNVK